MYSLPDIERPVSAIKAVIAPVRWLVRLEIGIWRSLFLLVTRRVSGQGRGVATFSYGKEVVPIMGAFIFVSVVELPVVHLLIPWETIRLIAILLSVWGLVWMVGLLASMKVFPHLLDANGLRIRYGASADVAIPWEAIASVERRKRRLAHRDHVQVGRNDDGAVLNVGVLKQTRVDVRLRQPTRVRLPGGTEEITECRFYADDPRALVAAADEHVT
jgi:hypothetical protein